MEEAVKRGWRFQTKPGYPAKKEPIIPGEDFTDGIEEGRKGPWVHKKKPGSWKKKKVSLRGQKAPGFAGRVRI